MGPINPSTNGQKQARPENTISQYQDTAYDSDDFPPQKSRPEQGFLRRMMTSGKHFSFSETTDSITVYGLDDLTPSKVTEGGKSSKQSYWNEISLNGESLSGWSQLYFLIVGIAKMCLMGLLPLLYVIFLLMWWLGGGGWNEGPSEAFSEVTLYATLPCLLIYVHFLLLNAGYFFVAPFLRAKRVFELNRTTGMVTLFKKNKPFFTHPFIEFDCVLMSSPTQQGFLNYS
jgi:hypothetical protein